VQKQTVEALARLMPPGGRVFLQSDVLEVRLGCSLISMDAGDGSNLHCQPEAECSANFCEGVVGSGAVLSTSGRVLNR